MATVAVRAEVLRWALQRSGNAAAIEARFPSLASWLRGESRPTLKQLERFAKATRTPLGYLFLSEPPEDHLPIPYFRTLDGRVRERPSPELLDTVHTMERRQAWMREYLLELEEEPLPFVRSARLHEPAALVAARIRETLRLSRSWAAQRTTWTDALRELRARAEDAGILVASNSVVGNDSHRRLDWREFRGFVLVDEYAPLVFLNGADAKAAQMFTLAHELAHVWFGHSAAFDLRQLLPAQTDIERACDRVAAELLVPEDEMRNLWPLVRRAADPFGEVARHFKVSSLVAARRALDLSLISRDAFLDFYRAHERNRRVPRPDGGDFYRTQLARLGRRFSEAVVGAVREGSLSYRDAYRLTGLYGQTFERFASRLEGWGT